MKILYISGPFGTKVDERDDYHSIDRNILTASEYSLAAARKGWAPFTPHKNTGGFQHVKDVSMEFWMEVCLEFVRRSDAILMLPRWEKSEGAIREKQIAIVHGIPVYYAQDGIPDAPIRCPRIKEKLP
jgi:hypothetical protein